MLKWFCFLFLIAPNLFATNMSSRVAEWRLDLDGQNKQLSERAKIEKDLPFHYLALKASYHPYYFRSIVALYLSDKELYCSKCSWTPIFWAVALHEPRRKDELAAQVVQIFRSLEVDFSHLDGDGNSLLHVVQDLPKTLTALLQTSAKEHLNLENKKGLTPLDVYLQRFNVDPAILQILMNEGARASVNISWSMFLVIEESLLKFLVQAGASTQLIQRFIMYQSEVNKPTYLRKLREANRPTHLRRFKNAES